MLIALLFLLALAIRWPNFRLVPRFEDESLEVLRGLAVARGDAMPLTGADLYYGPLFTWMMAGLFRLFDGGIMTARGLAIVYGALTVPATYALGLVVANRRAAIVAALLAMASPVLVVVGSHFGWSNSLTPCFATATLAAAYPGVTRRQAGMLVLAGLLAGLTMQTHPLTVVLVASIVIWYFVACPRREWFRRREAWWAVAAFALGYAPMLWTLAIRFSAVTTEVQRHSYAYGSVGSAGQYFHRLFDAATMLMLTVAGTGERLWAAFPEVTFLRGTIAAATVAVVLYGVFVSTSRRALPGAGTGHSRAFLAVILGLPVLLLPLFTQTLYSRYLMFLIPVACVCAGVAFAHLWETLSRPPVPARAHLPRPAKPGDLIGVLAVALAINFTAIVRVENRAIADGVSNAAFLALRDALERDDVSRNGMFIEDTNALHVPKGDANTWVYYNFLTVQFVSTMDDGPQTVAPAARLLELLNAQSVWPVWLLIPQQSVETFGRNLALTRVASIAPGPALPEPLPLVLFRVDGRK